MALSSVDLPQPEGPSSTRNSPALDLEVEVVEDADGAEGDAELADRDARAIAASALDRAGGDAAHEPAAGDEIDDQRHERR